MRRLLVALHPRAWRCRYGDEFAVLLDETRLTPLAIVDVLVSAARAHVRVRSGAALLVCALVVSGFFEEVSYRAGLTANILWAPTNPLRGVGLAATVAPWIALVVLAEVRRHWRLLKEG